MSEEESSFYVAIQDPKSFRRELLGSSKDMIKLLQKYEDIKKIREQKIKLMYEFSQTKTEIAMLMGKLKRAIPKTKLRNAYDNPKVIEKKKIVAPRKEVHPDLSSLQNELASIEEKLGKLK